MKEAEQKPYDLEERTFIFARDVRHALRERSWEPVAWSDVQQLLRASGSVAANYIESLEAISADDRVYRYRLCKKEARESGLWLRLILDCNDLDPQQQDQLEALRAEAGELVRIFAATIRNHLARNDAPHSPDQ